MAVSALRDVCKTLKSVIFLQRQIISTRTLYAHKFNSWSRCETRLFSSDVGSQKVNVGSDIDNTDLQSYPDDGTEHSQEEKPSFDPDIVESLILQQEQQSDLPLAEMDSPYKKPRRRCVLCKYDVQLDYKNVQLLSQFTSPYTGRIYGRHITGLCIPMQKRVAQLIQRSRNAGFMPFLLKETVYLQDPKLFDPFKPGSQKHYH